MAPMYHEPGKGWIVALCVALLLVQAQVTPGQMSDRARTFDGGVSGPCLPSCKSEAGAFYQRAAVLPLAAPAIPYALG